MYMSESFHRGEYLLLSSACLPSNLDRFPDSILRAVIDRLEKAYLFGFVLLQLFLLAYPLLGRSSPSAATIPRNHPQNGTCLPSMGLLSSPQPVAGCTSPPDPILDAPEGDLQGMEFLPLMLTSVYCALGLVWAFGRMGYFYVVKYR